jgi:AraC-like DNA-binding protein
MSQSLLQTIGTISVLLNFAAAFQAMLLGHRLFWNKVPQQVPNRLLALLLVTFTVNILNSVINFTGFRSTFFFFEDFSNAATLLIGPTLYLYMVIVTGQSKPRRRMLYHYLPFALYGSYGLLYHLVPNPISIEINDLVSNVMFLLLNAQIITYVSLSFLTLRKHDKHIHNLFSNIEQVSFQWISKTLIAFTVIYILVISTAVIEQLITPVNDIIKLNFVLIWSFQIFYLAYKSLGKTNPIEKLPDTDVNNPVLKSSQIQEYMKQAREQMEVESMYINPNLTLSDLATSIGVSSRYLSEAINQDTGSSFFDFVNAYRVKKVQDYLKDTEFEHLTLLGIASECGFQSSSTFNTAFKKHSGLTPSLYRKQVAEQTS